jgi:23S rRNA (pseudouridine1915-N3)-methyltransferase
MKVKLIVVGKTSERYLSEGINEYLNRLKHYVSFTYVEIPAPKSGKKTDENLERAKEADLLLNQFSTSDHVVLLDEKGKSLRSVEFAHALQQQMNRGVKQTIFVVGGPFGFDERLYARADEKLSLSKMTLSHQMIRLFFTEQLYRALSILKGEKYHHE